MKKLCGQLIVNLLITNCRKKKNFIAGYDLLKKINSRVDLVVICNPNNPTGKLIDEDLLLEVLEKCCRTGTKLLLDECFMDFVDGDKAYSLCSKLDKYHNLIILKAFTKHMRCQAYV